MPVWGRAGGPGAFIRAAFPGVEFGRARGGGPGYGDASPPPPRLLAWTRTPGPRASQHPQSSASLTGATGLGNW